MYAVYACENDDKSGRSLTFNNNCKLQLPHLRVNILAGLALIKSSIKSLIKSLIKSMRINQGIDLFDFFQDYVHM